MRCNACNIAVRYVLNGCSLLSPRFHKQTEARSHAGLRTRRRGGGGEGGTKAFSVALGPRQLSLSFGT